MSDPQEVPKKEMIEKPAPVKPSAAAAVKAALVPATVKKAVPSKGAVSAAQAESAKALRAARGSILKSTKQKPVVLSTEQHPYVSTGSTIVNSLIGGAKLPNGQLVCPGFPRRRITEVFGAESSGKTTLAIQAIVEVQKAGGSVIFLDFEHSLHHGYAKTIGVDFDEDKLGYYQPDSMEEGFKMLYIGIVAGVDLIVVDSVAAMVPKDELDKKLDETAKLGAVAKKMSETLPKITTWLWKYPKDGTGENAKTREGHLGTAIVLINQERATINTSGYSGGGTPEANTSGGKALKYYTYLRLKLARVLTERVERMDPISGKMKKLPYGNLTNVKVVKSKILGKQGHDANIFIRFGFGIDDLYSVIESGAGRGLIKKEGAYFAYGEHRFQGRDKFRAFLLSNGAVADEIRAKVADIIASEAKPISDEELSEEDQMLRDMANDMGEDDEDVGVNGEVPEIVVDDA